MNTYVAIRKDNSIEIKGFNGIKKNKYNDLELLKLSLKDFVLTQNCD